MEIYPPRRPSYFWVQLPKDFWWGALVDNRSKDYISTILHKTYAVLPARLEPILYPTGHLVIVGGRPEAKFNAKWFLAEITLMSSMYSLMPVCVETFLPATPSYINPWGVNPPVFAALYLLAWPALTLTAVLASNIGCTCIAIARHRAETAMERHYIAANLGKYFLGASASAASIMGFFSCGKELGHLRNDGVASSNNVLELIVFLQLFTVLTITTAPILGYQIGQVLGAGTAAAATGAMSAARKQFNRLPRPVFHLLPSKQSKEKEPLLPHTMKNESA